MSQLSTSERVSSPSAQSVLCRHSGGGSADSSRPQPDRRSLRGVRCRRALPSGSPRGGCQLDGAAVTSCPTRAASPTPGATPRREPAALCPAAAWADTHTGPSPERSARVTPADRQRAERRGGDACRRPSLRSPPARLPDRLLRPGAPPAQQSPLRDLAHAHLGAAGQTGGQGRATAVWHRPSQTIHNPRESGSLSDARQWSPSRRGRSVRVSREGSDHQGRPDHRQQDEMNRARAAVPASLRISGGRPTGAAPAQLHQRGH